MQSKDTVLLVSRGFADGCGNLMSDVQPSGREADPRRGQGREDGEKALQRQQVHAAEQAVDREGGACKFLGHRSIREGHSRGGQGGEDGEEALQRKQVH